MLDLDVRRQDSGELPPGTLGGPDAALQQLELQYFSKEWLKLQKAFRPTAECEADPMAVLPDVARKRVLFVTKTHEYGGAERHLIELLDRMQEPDLEIVVACFAMDPYTERIHGRPNLSVRKLAKTPGSVFEWISFFRSVHPDAVVFVHGWNWNLHWIAPIGAWLSGIPRRFAIQHLVLSGAANTSLAHRVLQKIFRHLNLKVSAATLDATICVSDAVKNELIEQYGFPRRKMRTIRNGVSLSEFAPAPSGGDRIRREYGIAEDEFLLLCAARLSEQKGIDILLTALARTIERGVPCKCVIVGDGPLRQGLVEQARNLRLEQNVFFAGFKEDIRPYLHAGSVFILTSHKEGLPLAILEAMACGMPCIVTDVGGSREAVTDRVNGLLIPAGSVDAAVEAIEFLAANPEKRNRMSHASLERVRKEFDLETCMMQIKRVILN